MDPSIIHPRYSLNIYNLKDEPTAPKTWPLRVKQRESLIISDDIWPQPPTHQNEPETLIIGSVRKKTRVARLRFSVKDIDYLTIKEGGSPMEPAPVRRSLSRTSSMSPPSQRKQRAIPKISVEAPADDKEDPEAVKMETHIERVSKKRFTEHLASQQLRRALSRDFLRAPKIQRTKSANDLTPGSETHAIKEVAKTKFKLAHLPPMEIFGTVTRKTAWKAPVQPAFDRILIHRKTDRDNVGVIQISPKKHSKDVIVESTLHYYVRLVEEVYRQQGFFKITPEEIKSQIIRLSEYEIPKIEHIATEDESEKSLKKGEFDYKKMEEDLHDVHCFDVLRRLTTRGFAPANYASMVLWPELFPSPKSIMDLENEVRQTGKKSFYLFGKQINSVADILLKRRSGKGGHITEVRQKKLYMFDAVLLSGIKVPKDDRKVGKYNIVEKKVPIGSLVLVLKSRDKDRESPFYTFCVRIEAVTPLNLDDFKEDEHYKKFIKRADKVQKVWIRETRKFHHDKLRTRHAVEIKNKLMLYPGNSFPTDIV